MEHTLNKTFGPSAGVTIAGTLSGQDKRPICIRKYDSTLLMKKRRRSKRRSTEMPSCVCTKCLAGARYVAHVAHHNTGQSHNLQTSRVCYLFPSCRVVRCRRPARFRSRWWMNTVEQVLELEMNGSLTDGGLPFCSVNFKWPPFYGKDFLTGHREKRQIKLLFESILNTIFKRVKFSVAHG